jgi:DNA-directed RNA polymerase specialized sigma24 family protein
LFHRSVADLPQEQHDVVNLSYDHGWTPEQAAGVIGISARTVRRRWQAALVQLHWILNPIERL